MDKEIKILDFIEKSSGVSIDTRTIKSGEVFFALKGENFDGNRFVNDALKKGAALVVSSDSQFASNSKVICVKNTLLTLQNLARIYRDRLHIPVLAITGTNGKTTTKELICRMLSTQYNVLCTKGNLNNHIGVPLTLFSIKKAHKLAIIEMGASGVGEIEFLSNIANPNYGLITGIGIAHIEGFGSLENIIKTKTELYRYLARNKGTFFYNNYIKELSEIINSNESVSEFNAENILGKNIKKVKLVKTYPFLDMEMTLKDNNTVDINTHLYGKYNFINIVNAIKVADYFGVSPENVKNALQEFKPDNNRSQIMRYKDNELIMDAYNANPTSMKSAIESFEHISDRRDKYLILGDMLEMGKDSLTAHIDIINYLKDKSFYKKIIFIGKEFGRAGKDLMFSEEKIYFVKDAKEAGQLVDSMQIKNSIVLVKASRGIRAETIFI